VEGDEVVDLVECTTLNAGAAGSLIVDMIGGDVKVYIVIVVTQPCRSLTNEKFG
jgi:hypothetical protein